MLGHRKVAAFAVFLTLAFVLLSVVIVMQLPGKLAYEKINQMGVKLRETLGGARTLQEALKSREINGTVIVVCADSGYSGMALNLYHTSFKKLNLTNYLFIGTDTQICDNLNIYGIACFTHVRHAAKDSTASDWGTPEFRRKTHYKTKATLDALRLGITVLLVDVDIVFFKNPLPYLLCKTCDIQIQNDMVEGNSGFYLARPTSAAIMLHDRAYNASLSPFNKLTNQKLLDRTMEKMIEWEEIVVQFLPDQLFPNGEVYFERGRRMFAGDNPCSVCVIVHNNWILTGAAKELRFKENGLWDVDTKGYYSNPNTKYIMYNNPNDFGPDSTLFEETQALKAALVLGDVLHRTVILPRFHCYGCHFKPCHMTHHGKCAFGTFYKVSNFDNSFSDAYRESTFLKHDRVPQSVKNAIRPEFLISTNRSTSFDQLSYQNPEKYDHLTVLRPENGHTPSVSEIKAWFQPFLMVPIIQFHSLYALFDNLNEFKVMNEKLSNAFVPADYRNF